MSDSQTKESFDVYGVTIDFEPLVGMTIDTATDNTWVSWDETVKIAEWLAKKVEACK